MRCSQVRKQWLSRITQTPAAGPDPDGSLAVLSPLFAACGEMPWHHPQMLAGRLLGAECAPGLVYLWPEDQPRVALGLRPRARGVWQSLFPGAPLLVDPGAVDCRLLEEILAQIQVDAGAEVLYFPLVYPETSAAALLASVSRTIRWERSPSPVIAWNDAGAGIDTRFHQRYGRRAGRKEKRWQENLRATMLPPREAIRALTRIEAASWKAGMHADLGSSGQLACYQHLLHEGLVELVAAMYHDEPIAYRLDCAFRETVYILEWSFDQRYAALAPGMFLLVKGLVQRWERFPLAYIDLAGSPDMLKSLLETGRRPRQDLAWPAGRAAQRLCVEQRGHDALLASCLSQGIGVRRAYS